MILAPVIPEKIRPTNSQKMVGAQACIKKLIENPKSENKIWNQVRNIHK